MKKEQNNIEQSKEKTLPAGEEKKKKLSFKDLFLKLKALRFYKKKRFYTILIIVFSVLLAAALVTGPLARMASGFSQISSAFSGAFDTDMSDIDTDTDFSADTADDDSVSSGGLPSGGTLPGASDTDSSADAADDTSSDDTSSDSDTSGDTASDDESADAADNSSVSALPDSDGSFDTGSLPGDMSSAEGFSGFDDTDESSASEDADASSSDPDAAAIGARSLSSGGFLSWYGSAWKAIAIILLILDIAAVVMRILLGKKLKKQAKEALKEQAKEEGRIYIDKGPVKKEKNAKTSWIIPVAVILAVILVVNLISSGGTTTTAQTSASDLSATAETGTIAVTVPGTGTLQSEDAVDLSYADGVTVTKWYVSNGDSVEEGDTLAKVDQSTVLSAIASVQEAIEALDAEIAEHEDDEISDTITAAADGRVKAVYAQEDTSVVDTMYEYGALIVISLDGLMAVDVETDSLSKGDTVTVTLSDETEEEGTVESVTNGTAVITLTDEGPEIGESVTVTDSDGDEAGTGILYVHSALNVTGFSGTVSDISVSVEDEVSSGDTLLTLDDTDYTAEYEALIEQREELSDQIAKLFVLYATGYLYADTAGVVSGIDDSDASSDDSSDADTDSDTDDDSSEDSASAQETSLKASAEVIAVSQVAESTSGSGYSSSEDESSEEETEASSDDASEAEEDVTLVGYVSAAESTQDGLTVVIATLSGTLETVEITSERSIYTFEGSDFSETDISSIEAGNIIFYTSDSDEPIYVFGLSSSSSQYQEGSEGSETSETSEDLSSSGLSSDTQSQQQEASAAEASEDTASAADTASLASVSADTSDTEASGDVSTTEEAVTTTYSVTETVLCSITPQDYMTVEITVDELDILSLEVGQSAVVTLDAYTGQSFEGEVISVSLSPTNSGGNSKYTAVIQIERTEDMLSGMNASVSITVDETDEVVMILAAAVFEEDGVYYVYTSFNEKSGTYSDAVAVTLGASDGEYVEVTDGLSQGDIYYYSYLDTVNYSSATVTGSASLFSFGQ